MTPNRDSLYDYTLNVFSRSWRLMHPEVIHSRPLVDLVAPAQDWMNAQLNLAQDAQECYLDLAFGPKTEEQQ